MTDLCFCGSGELFGWCCASEEPDREPPHGVHIIREFLDADRCREWKELLERQPRAQSGVYDARRSSGTELKATVGSGRTSQKVSPGPLADPIRDTVARAFGEAEQLFERQFQWFELPKVLRYGPDNHYGTHADNCFREKHQDFWTKGIDRDVSLLIYLNQDFEGGSLSFEKFRYDYQPRTGDLLLFPSDNRYKHGANPVISGVRYVIVSWAAYADEPKVHASPPGAVVPMPGYTQGNKESN